MSASIGYEIPPDNPAPEAPVDVAALDPSAHSGWRLPGDVTAAFLKSDIFVRALMGPYGSGKTVTCEYPDLLFKAVRQPRDRQGIRRHKALFLRDTYRDLYKTTIPTYLMWIPKEAGKWVGGTDRPASHELRLFDKFGPIELTIEFAAIGDHKAEDVLDGYEVNHCFMNAATSIQEEVLQYMVGRVGRYPPRHLYTPENAQRVWKGITLDLNPPDTDHWIYKFFVEQKPDPARVKLFRQPGAFEPGAENLNAHSDDYYDNMVATNPKWWVRRFVHNQWGYSRDGQPVYEEYDDEFHAAAKPLKPIPGRPIGLGIDGGQTLRPAIIFGQLNAEGQWRIIDELAPGRCGATRCAEMFNVMRAEKYHDFEFYGFADPTAASGADREGGELSWLETFTLQTGVDIDLAPSNELGLRLDAVSQALGRRLPGGKPGLLLSPECGQLRKGFASHYRFRRVKSASGDRFEDKPEKNDFSHPHDGLQYLVLGREGAHAVRSGSRSLPVPDNGEGDRSATLAASNGWSPLDV